MPRHYCYLRAGKVHGPVTSPQLRSLAASGELDPEDLVWVHGAKTRFEAKRVQGLFADSEYRTAPSVDLPPTADDSSEFVDNASFQFAEPTIEVFDNRNATPVIITAGQTARSRRPSFAAEVMADTWNWLRGLFLQSTKFAVKVAIATIALSFCCCGGPLLLVGLSPKSASNWAASASDETILEGTTCKFRRTIGPIIVGYTVMYDTMAAVYDIAKAHPEIDRLEIELLFNYSGFKDKYGNEVDPTPRSIGHLTLDEAYLNEVRKYKTKSDYTARPLNQFIFVKAMEEAFDLRHVHDWPPKIEVRIP